MGDEGDFERKLYLAAAMDTVGRKAGRGSRRSRHLDNKSRAGLKVQSGAKAALRVAHTETETSASSIVTAIHTQGELSRAVNSILHGGSMPEDYLASSLAVKILTTAYDVRESRGGDVSGVSHTRIANLGTNAAVRDYRTKMGLEACSARRDY